MKDLKRISWLAICLIVVLRISIGWQFLYEGMWKYSQMSGPTPWTSEGYLKGAQGPFRETFRNMVGDPDELNWLDYEQMSQKWYAWRDKFVKHYKLKPEQAMLLNILLDSSAESDSPPGELPPFPVFSRKVEELPPSVNLARYRESVTYDPKTKQLTAIAPILPLEERQIKAMVNVVSTGIKEQPFVKRNSGEDPDATPEPADPVEASFYAAFDYLVTSSRAPIDRLIADLSIQTRGENPKLDPQNFEYANSRISSTLKRSLPFRHRLAASLLGDPERVGVYGRLNDRGTFDISMGTVVRREEDAERHGIRFGKIREYKKLLDEYETALKEASVSYQLDHATMLGRKAAIMRAELTGPVKTLESELKEAAQKILTPEQLALGAPRPDDTPLYRADMAAMWGLLILGPCLIIGLFTRFSAILGAVMVLSFYLVIPPWPGVPPAPGPEHSLIVNKNLIEVIALLGIAALPTGSWFGIDAFFYRLFTGKKTESQVAVKK